MINRKKSIYQSTFAYVSGNQDSYSYRWVTADSDYHQHTDFYELILITKGAFIHYYEGNKEITNEGELLLFDIGATHRLVPCDSKSSIHFTVCLSKQYFHLLEQIFSSNRHLFSNNAYQRISLDPSAFQYLLSLSNALTNNPKNAEKIIRLYFHSALYASIEVNQSHDDIADDIIEKLCNYTYLTLDMQEIYNRYPYSIPTIIKKFKQRTGITVSQYQTNIRLQYAAQLLRETNNTVENIAFDIGFTSTGHFFDIFKKHYGVSPNAYRKKEQQLNSVTD